MLKDVMMSALTLRQDDQDDNQRLLHELVALLGWDVLTHVCSAPSKKASLLMAINRQIAAIDHCLQVQLDSIIHDPVYQALESAWRGCHYLLEQIGPTHSVKVKLLDISAKELNRDITRAIEVDQSELFNKVYSREFGTAGGEPFGVMLCNYPIASNIRKHGVDSIGLINGLSAVAAASFCPFIFNADPSLIDLEDFSALNSNLDLTRTYQQLSFTRWKSLRSKEDSRFIGLTLPYVYIRRPYKPSNLRCDQFVYKEPQHQPEHFLKMGAIYAFGAVMARCFANTGWLAEITGDRYFGGGIVPGLNEHRSEIDREKRIFTEIVIPDALERTLTEYGFISLCCSVNAGEGAFYSVPSIQVPAKYSSAEATINARYSAMLQYVLCTSRFAHYLKVIVRDQIGDFATAEECRSYLQNWIMQYVMATDEASEVLLAKYPLRDARVLVSEIAGASGSYNCVVHLKPHFQLETIETSIQFSAEVVTNRITG